MAKVRVAIAGTEFIPCLGKGPFSDIWIHEELYRILQRLGYVVTKLDQDAHLDLNVPVQPVSAPAEVLESAPVAEPAATEAQPEPVAPVAEVTEQPAPVAEPVAPVAEVAEQSAPVAEVTEPVAEQPAPVAEPAVVEQPVVEEMSAAEVAEEESSEEAQPVEVTLTAEEEEALKTTATKKEIQEILTAHGVKYKYNDTIEQLLAYVGLTR